MCQEMILVLHCICCLCVAKLSLLIAIFIHSSLNEHLLLLCSLLSTGPNSSSWPGPLNGRYRLEFDQIWCADVCMHISAQERSLAVPA